MAPEEVVPIVGGPHDGTVVTVIRGAPRVSLAVHDKIRPPPPVDWSVSATHAIRKEDYVRMRAQNGRSGNRIEVFRHSKMNEDDALACIEKRWRF